MTGYIIMGTLAAFGAFSILWAVLGWLLPAGQGCVLVCCGQPDPGILSRYRWLRGAGLLRCPLVCVGAAESCAGDDLEICAGDALLSRLEWERNQKNGTGNGDSPGYHQCRGVSEL